MEKVGYKSMNGRWDLFCLRRHIQFTLAHLVQSGESEEFFVQWPIIANGWRSNKRRIHPGLDCNHCSQAGLLVRLVVSPSVPGREEIVYKTSFLVFKAIRASTRELCHAWLVPPKRVNPQAMQKLFTPDRPANRIISAIACIVTPLPASVHTYSCGNESLSSGKHWFTNCPSVE